MNCPSSIYTFSLLGFVVPLKGDFANLLRVDLFEFSLLYKVFWAIELSASLESLLVIDKSNTVDSSGFGKNTLLRGVNVPSASNY